jgi:hypothetical protein
MRERTSRRRETHLPQAGDIQRASPAGCIGAAAAALELGGARPAFDPSRYSAVFDHSEVVRQIELAYGRDYYGRDEEELASTPLRGHQLAAVVSFPTLIKPIVLPGRWHTICGPNTPYGRHSGWEYESSSDRAA